MHGKSMEAISTDCVTLKSQVEWHHYQPCKSDIVKENPNILHTGNMVTRATAYLFRIPDSFRIQISELPHLPYLFSLNTMFQ